MSIFNIQESNLIVQALVHYFQTTVYNENIIEVFDSATEKVQNNTIETLKEKIHKSE